MAESAESLARGKEALLAELQREIRDPRVLDAIRGVPREEFLPADLRPYAYENRPLPIGEGQTISQPLMVGLMTEALMLTGDEKVLEVGTGSGYQAALLSLLADHVVTVERMPALARTAAERLERLGYRNVEVCQVMGQLGWPDGAPYDAIIITAAAPDVAPSLLAQLGDGGRLVAPVGGRTLQELVRIVKTPQGAQRHNLGPCRFVPLLGKDAWPDAGA